MSKDKKGVLALAHKGNEVQKPEDILRDHYVLEFSGIKPQARFKENLRNRVRDATRNREMIDNTINDDKTITGGKGAILVGRYHILRQLGQGGKSEK